MMYGEVRNYAATLCTGLPPALTCSSKGSKTNHTSSNPPHSCYPCNLSWMNFYNALQSVLFILSFEKSLSLCNRGKKSNISLLDRCLFGDKLLIMFLFFTQWFALCTACKPQTPAFALFCVALFTPFDGILLKERWKKLTSAALGLIILMWFCSKYLVHIAATARAAAG